MKIEETDRRLVLREDRLFALIVFAVLAAVFFVFTVGVMVFDLSRCDVSLALPAAALVWLGSVVLLCAADYRIVLVFDKDARTLVWTRKALFRKREDAFRFDEFQIFSSEPAFWENTRTVTVRTGEGAVPLISCARERADEAAERMSEFLESAVRGGPTSRGPGGVSSGAGAPVHDAVPGLCKVFTAVVAVAVLIIFYGGISPRFEGRPPSHGVLAGLLMAGVVYFAFAAAWLVAVRRSEDQRRPSRHFAFSILFLMIVLALMSVCGVVKP
ncbi:MAG TPA: hypothetical protein P5079_03455 [Elusimicrobiota bacterium]|nr:hypothetical protein [Elusimicrobiota bacterium]